MGPPKFPDATLFVYDSDPGRYLFRSDVVATNAMYEVPCVVWFSPAYRRGNPGFVRAVTAARDRPFQTRALYDSVIDLLRFTHPLYDPTDSLFAPGFVEQPRLVGAMHRVYQRDATGQGRTPSP